MLENSKATPACAAPGGCAATTLLELPVRASVCAEAVVTISQSTEAETSATAERPRPVLQRPVNDEELEDGDAAPMILVMPGCGAVARACLVRLEESLVRS